MADGLLYPQVALSTTIASGASLSGVVNCGLLRPRAIVLPSRE